MKNNKKAFGLFAFILFFFCPDVVNSQTAETPFHKETIAYDFGTLNGKPVNNGILAWADFFNDYKTPAGTRSFPPDSYLKFNTSVMASKDAPWVRLRFSNVNLGQNSYLVIISDFDQDKQYFNGNTISEWQNQTAFFKGNALTVEVYVAPGETNISLQIDDMTVGEFYGNQPLPDLCGSDNRVSSSYPYMDGRILPIGCTGWIGAGGFYFTAGHCVNVSSNNLQVIQFNVPASLCDGTLVPSAIADQYPIIYSSRVYQEADIGNDWGLFNCGANSSTGLTPVEAQRAYYHLSKNLNPAIIQIRGFGTDHTPSGCTGYYNSDSQTLQYDSGSSLGEHFNGSNDVYWEYLVDTEGGNSGSAIKANVSGISNTAIGIHTHGGCNPPSTGNKGTSFEADDTEAAMNSYWQSQSEYVDGGHHLGSSVGSSVKPNVSVQNAINQANAGHGPGTSNLELILVAGSNNGSGGIYDEAITYSGASNGVVIRRTVGAVKIGPSASDQVENNEPTIPNSDPATKIIQQNIDGNYIFPGETKSFDKLKLEGK